MKRPATKRPLRALPRVEFLENRWCPSAVGTLSNGTLTFTDTNPNDSISVMEFDTGPGTNIVGIYNDHGVKNNSPGWTCLSGASNVTSVVLNFNSGSSDNITIDLNGIPYSTGKLLNVFANLFDTNNTFNYGNTTYGAANLGGTGEVSLSVGGTTNLLVIGSGGGSDAAGECEISYVGSNAQTDETVLQGFYTNHFDYSNGNGASTDSLYLGYDQNTPSTYPPGVTPPGGGNSVFWDFFDAFATLSSNSGKLVSTNAVIQGNFTLNGGGANDSVTLGTSGNFQVFGTSFLDADTAAAGSSLSLGPSSDLKGAVTIDDFSTITTNPTSLIESNVTVNHNDTSTTATFNGTIKGSLTYNSSNVIGGDGDDGGSGSSAVDSLTLAAGSSTGATTVNEGSGKNTVNVAGTVNGAFTVNGGNGNSDAVTIAGTASITGGASVSLGNGTADTVTVGAATGTTTITGDSSITVGSGNNDSVTVNKSATFTHSLAINLGGTTGANQTVLFDGTVGTVSPPANPLTIGATAASGGTFSIELGGDIKVTGTATVNLQNAAVGTTVTWDTYTTGSITGKLLVNGNGNNGSPNVAFHHTTHTTSEYTLSPGVTDAP
jgi:hypothetical protein